MTLSNN